MATDDTAADVIAWLQRSGSPAVRAGMARFAIPSDKAFGISVATLRTEARRLGRSHALATALWASGWYEARMLACFVDEPAQVSAAQMDRWCGGFDNWAIVDTACFALFDLTPHAWLKVGVWATRRAEFEKRAAFALLWALSVHDKTAGDAPFIDGLRLIEQAADDERNFVKKAVNMALRAIGKRNPALNVAAVETARRLAALPAATPRWIGKHALRELTSPAMGERLAKRARPKR
ncbi:MAG: DNA alkylation repair protein [Burkholderiales bacterium]